MIIFILALTALLVSYSVNRVSLKYLRENAVIYAAPVIEELFKTIPAYLLDRPLFYIHLLFGIGEALYDLFTGSPDSGKWAALVSILSHSIFGGITVLIYSKSGTIVPALIAAIVFHWGWNYAIMYCGRSKR